MHSFQKLNSHLAYASFNVGTLNFTEKHYFFSSAVTNRGVREGGALENEPKPTPTFVISLSGPEILNHKLH